MEKTTTMQTPQHSPAPLPGYGSLRYLLDALAKRAAKAAGVPETDIYNSLYGPLLRDEYDAMPLPQRAALCRAAHLAFNDAKRPIPDLAPFDAIYNAPDSASWGARYLAWFAVMDGKAAKRKGIAKLEIRRMEPFANLRMHLTILFYLEADEQKAAREMPYTLTLSAVNFQGAVDLLASTWPQVELVTPGQFDALLIGWRATWTEAR